MTTTTSQLSSSRTQRDALIATHVEVARRIALRVGRRVPDWVSRDDLISAAMVGLAEAADRYDVGREEPFLGFAERRIRGAVLDELRRNDFMPRRVRAKARKVGEVIQALEQELGRTPDDIEVAERLDISVEEYQQNLRMLTHVSVVDMVDAEGRERPLPVQDEPSVADAVERAELIGHVRDALTRLNERDALVLSLYYDEELNYREIGDILGVTESRVCQLHSRAIARLRAELQ